MMRVVCVCGYEAFANDPPTDCPACGQQLLIEPYGEREPFELFAGRREGSPGLVWTRCRRCNCVVVNDEDESWGVCPPCKRAAEKRIEGSRLDLYAGRTGGHSPNG